MDVALGLGLIVLGLIVYFLPSIVAHTRSHLQENAIVLLNLFLGWTFIGWVAALVWAAMAVRVDVSGSQTQPMASRPIFPKLIAGLIAIGVFVLGGGYLAYNAKKQAEFKDDAITEQRSSFEQPAHKVEVPVDTVSYLPIDNMVVKLADPDGDHFAQIGLTFELRAKSDEARVNAALPTIRSQMIELISRRASADLLTRQGKEKLADDILQVASAELNSAAVTRILFSSFIVQ